MDAVAGEQQDGWDRNASPVQSRSAQGTAPALGSSHTPPGIWPTSSRRENHPGVTGLRESPYRAAGVRGCVGWKGRPLS